MVQSRTHVIIGDGATAAAFVASVQLHAGDTLIVVGPNVNQLGRGLAYRDHAPDKAWRFAYLMNSPNAAFGDAFTDWFADNWETIQAEVGAYQPHWLAFNAGHIAAKDFGAMFSPRAVFGQWLTEQSNDALAVHHDKGVKVSLRSGLASDLSLDGEKVRITLSTGDVIHADRVDVATGGPATQRYGADAGPTAFTTLYGNEDDIAKVLGPQQAVTCLGGNAAMLDVLRFLQAQLGDQDIRFRVIKRAGEPEALIYTRPRVPPVRPQITGPFETADALLAAIDDEIAAFRLDGATMAELRPGYREWAVRVDMTKVLPSLAERKTLSHRLEHRFRRGSHDTIADYQRLADAGQITEVIGNITWVHAQGANDVRVRVQAEGTTSEEHASVVINTSGQGKDLALDLMTSSLVRNGWLALNEARTGVAVAADLGSQIEQVRYLSPAVTEIGGEPLAFPLYDVVELQQLVMASDVDFAAKVGAK